MSSSDSRALITDFDGTLVRLAVDWAALRAKLGVDRIGDAVQRGHTADLQRIAAAECDGALRGMPLHSALRFAESFARLAVITQNSESAVAVFLERHPTLQQRCTLVLGRESHAQRKHEPEVMAGLVARCLPGLGVDTPAAVTYLGDESYELAAARALGMHVVDVASLSPAR